MPTRNNGEWFGWNRSPLAAAKAIEGIISSVPPVAIIAVTIRQLIAERIGNSMSCLSERRMTKLCLTSCQVRENLPIAPSYSVPKRGFGLRQVWKKGWEPPIVHRMHSQGTVNA